MTVKEAFEKAGYPIPDGGLIGYSWRGHAWDWFGRVSCLHHSDRAGQGFKFVSQWSFFPCEPGHEFEPHFDLSNVSAIDAWTALPSVVTRALEGK